MSAYVIFTSLPGRFYKVLNNYKKSSYVLVETILLLYLLQFVCRIFVQNWHLLVKIRIKKVFLVIKSLISMIIMGLLIFWAVVAGYDVLLGF